MPARARRHAVARIRRSWACHAVKVSAQTIPASVGIPGNYQSEAGCAGDWDPACPATQLVYDANGDIWRNTFSITPAGALRIQGGAQRHLGRELRPACRSRTARTFRSRRRASPQNVTFYYDHKTHWVTENVSSIIATVPGSFQSEMGCSGDWDPSCFRSWLQDINDTSIYSFSTSAIPAGFV